MGIKVVTFYLQDLQGLLSLCGVRLKGHVPNCHIVPADETLPTLPAELTE